MPIPVLPLNEMSVEEKLETMETIWKSLSASPEGIESPAWHEEELRVREARVASGEAKFIDWQEAKEEIRRQTSWAL
jgi:nucleoside phosphorylase